MLFFCFCFSLKQTFIRLTHQMMTFPVWQAGVFIRSMVGMQQPPFKKTKNKHKINPKVNLLQHIPEWQIIIYTCVLQSQSIDHFCPTLSLQVRSCWALWIQSTTVGGGGNHGSGKSLKYSRYWFTDLSEIQSKLVFQCKLNYSVVLGLNPSDSSGSAAAALYPCGWPWQRRQKLETPPKLPPPDHCSSGVCARLPVWSM